MHSFYLRNMYMKNALKMPDGYPSRSAHDVGKVSVPTYFVSAVEDHIAPWKTTYAGPRLLGGKSRFVLSGSGHIAGMINPPSAKKYGYWTNEELPEDAEQWLEGARQHEGSWWEDWIAGSDEAGSKVTAREPGKGRASQNSRDRSRTGQLCAAAHRHGVTRNGGAHGNVRVSCCHSTVRSALLYRQDSL